jgi:hypothetical protein
MRGAKHTNFLELRKGEVQVDKHTRPKIHLPNRLPLLITSEFPYSSEKPKTCIPMRKSVSPSPLRTPGFTPALAYNEHTHKTFGFQARFALVSPTCD